MNRMPLGDCATDPDGADLPRGRPPRNPGPRLVPMALLFYGALLAAAVAWRVLWAGESLLHASPEAAAAGVDLLRDPAAGMALGLALVGLSRLWVSWTRSGERLERAFREVLGVLDLRSVLVLAAVSGIAEEAFFRGALQPVVGLVPASLLFGLAHFVPRRDLAPWSASAVVAGFALGVLYEWTGNLVGPICAHAVINGINLRWLGRERNS